MSWGRRWGGRRSGRGVSWVEEVGSGRGVSWGRRWGGRRWVGV